MTENDKHFLKEFITGAGIASCVLLVFFAFVFLIGKSEPPPDGVESPRFRVVDKYKGCDIVRFAPPNDADYSYFLDCH